MKDKITFLFKCLITPDAVLPELRHRQANLLARILLFVLLFSIFILFILLIFNPHHDPARNQYLMLTVGLAVFTIIISILNCRGPYHMAATLFIADTAILPWLTLLFDPSILKGDFVPLTYLIFSVMLSSILLPTSITIILAIFQFLGIAMVLLFSSDVSSFNWFSFLAFILLTSVFSIISNNIIQGNIRKIAEQAQQLASNQARLQELSIRDHLTGLFNRRYLEEMLEREIQRAIRAQQPVGILILDVDHFKQINDTLGHIAGDIVLHELGKFLSRQIRQSDIACRYGGDEFVIILPDTSRETAQQRAEQLRYGVGNIFKDHKDPPVSERISISLGVAAFPDDGSTGEVVLKAADTALLQAKHSGSNQVVMAGKSGTEMHG